MCVEGKEGGEGGGGPVMVVGGGVTEIDSTDNASGISAALSPASLGGDT